MWSTAALLALAATPAVLAQVSSVATCNATIQCPTTAPCCSEYGFCGKGSYCLGGCEPLFSSELDSCNPNPACKTQTSTFTDLSRVLTNHTEYNGNATAWDWVVDKGAVELDPNGEGLRLTLTDENGGSGTLLSSTRYVHYGRIDFTMKTSKWAGVVSAAITMSDVKDEIDWEWPGKEVLEAQSNYFFMGHINYTAATGGVHNISSDSAAEFHKYSINWHPESLEWLIDDKLVRKLDKEDTLQDGVYKYPQTPSRVQISIWPAGIESVAEGTRAWAGGMIDWSDDDYVSSGYFWNTIQSIEIACDLDVSDTVQGYEYAGKDEEGVPNVTYSNRSMTLSGARPAVAASTGALALAVVAVVGLPWMSWALV